MKSILQSRRRGEKVDPEVIMMVVTMLQPVEVVILQRYARAALDLAEEAFPALARHAQDFDRQMRTLPSTNLRFAKEVYRTFAQSPYPADRISVASTYLNALTKADHDAGFQLRHQLVRDAHAGVREFAYRPVHAAAHADSSQSDASVPAEGLTPGDIVLLTEAFEAAERGENLYTIEETSSIDALREATELYEGMALAE